MKALDTKYKRWLAVAGIGIYLLVALSFTHNKFKQIRCTHIDVNVLDSAKAMFISPKDITQLISKNEFNIIGYPLSDINTLVVERAITMHPSIKSAQVYSSVKGALKVAIQQREPIVRIMNKNGTGYYIDLEGDLMPLSDNYTARVPIINGAINKSYQKYKIQNFNQEKSDSLLQSVYRLSLAIYRNPYWNAMTDQLYTDNEQNISIIPKTGADQIFLGRTFDFDKDLNILTEFYNQVLPVVGWEKYKTINLKFNKQVVCKK
ncbi:MAG: hypothetical protein JXR60_10760 [Bacteroidales bacterium]|nr:hypothetical protein [Bacteroidales bacterium]